jgi:hypothetical protein
MNPLQILYFCHCFQLPCFKATFSDIAIVDVAATGEAGTSYPSEAPCLFSVVRVAQTLVWCSVLSTIWCLFVPFLLDIALSVLRKMLLMTLVSSRFS